MTSEELETLERYISDVQNCRGMFSAARLRLIAAISDSLAAESRKMADAKDGALRALLG